MSNNKHVYLLLVLIISSFLLKASNSDTYEFAVIGAGPAGITSVAVLLENGVPKEDILWIDPSFNVGRLGKYYAQVPSNEMAGKFVEFLMESPIFRKISTESFEKIKQYNANKEPLLQLIIDPLQDITNYLKKHVTICCDKVMSINKDMNKKDDLHNPDNPYNKWTLSLNNLDIYATKVILATGAHPKRYLHEKPAEIPLDLALDKNKLSKLTSKDDTVMVIGSAHSAMLLLKHLTEIGVKKIISVYKREPVYGAPGGLKGITAWWTKEILEKNTPKNIDRVRLSPDIIDRYKDVCDKVIYAFGFERDPILINNTTDIKFDCSTGIIQPNLYGIGIAFPEQCDNKEGKTVNLIGVNSFMKYAKAMIPSWIKNK